MKTIDLAQNSPEWLEFRRAKIGASDAPVIMGISPYKTPYQLYLEKVERIDQAQNSAMKRGQEMEAGARKAFEQMYESLYMDKVCVVPLVVQSEKHEWMIASLDGIDIEKGIAVEIKCPGPKDHEIARDGKIPDHYMPQLQHQLAVTGLERMFYFSYRNGEAFPVILECKRDEDMLKRMVEKEKEFMDCILHRQPPALTERDYEERYDMEFIELAMRYEVVKRQADQKAEEEQHLKDELIRLSSGKNCRGGKVKISQCCRKGAIEYGKIEQLQGIDLELYRKSPTKYTTVTLAS